MHRNEAIAQDLIMEKMYSAFSDMYFMTALLFNGVITEIGF